MFKRFKTLLFTALFSFLCFMGYGQTYLSLVVGYELTGYKERINNSYFMTPPIQNNLNFLIGLMLEQKLGERFALTFQHNWSKKHISSEGYDWALFDDFPDFSGIAFRYNRNILFFNYNITKSISLGLGHSYNRYKKVKFVTSPSERLNNQIIYLNSTLPPSNQSDYGLAFNLNYQITQFSIEFQYHHTYHISEANSELPTLFLPPKAISLSVAYRFKILNTPTFSGWKRKEGCPTF